MPTGQEMMAEKMEIQKAGTEVTRLETRRGLLAAEVEALEKRLKTERERVDKKAAELRREECELTEKVEAVRADLAMAWVDEQAATRTREEIEAAGQAAQRALEKAQAELEEVTGRVTSARRQEEHYGPMQANYARLTREVKEKEDERDRIGEQIQRAEQQSTSLQAQMEEAQQRAEVAERRVGEGRHWEDAVRTDLEDRTQGLGMREADLNTREAAIEGQKVEVERREGDLSQKWETFHTALKDFEAKKTELAEREALIEDEEKDARAEREQLDLKARELEAREKTATEREFELDTLTGELTRKGEELAKREEKAQLQADRFAQRVREVQSLVRAHKLATDISEFTG